MIEAYAIGVSAKLEDGVTPALLKIIETADKASASLDGLLESIKLLSKSGLRLGRNLDGAAKSAETLGATSGSLSRASAVMDSMAASSADIARNLRAANVANAGLGRGHGGWGSSSSSGSHGSTPKGFGTGALVAGVVGYEVVKGGYEQAKRLIQAQTDFETMNLSPAQNKLAYSKASSMADTLLGTNITDNIETIHDLHTAFGDLGKAMKSADGFAKFAFVDQIMNGGKRNDKMTYDAAKALEHRGQKVIGSDAAFDYERNLMSQVYMGSRGRVTPSDYLQASKTGKLAYTLMDPKELYGQFAAYMTTQSGFTAGTALQTFDMSVIGGHMDNKGKGFLAGLGLWQEGVSKARMKAMQAATKGMSAADLKASGYLIPSSGGLKEQYIGMAQTHPIEFIQDVLAPAIRKRYGANLSDEAVAGLLMQNLNRNTAGFAGAMVVNEQKFKKDSAIFGHSKNSDQAYLAYLHSPEGAQAALDMQWKNVLTTLGSMYLQSIKDSVLKIANILSQFDSVLKDNGKHRIDGIAPTSTKDFFYRLKATTSSLKGAVTSLWHDTPLDGFINPDTSIYTDPARIARQDKANAIHNHIYIDGKEVHRSMMNHSSPQPQRGSNGVNPQLNVLHPNMNYAPGL